MNKETTQLSYTLSIRISTDGFCFCTYSPHDPESVRYTHYECDSRQTLVANFDTAWEASGLAAQRYSKIQVIVATSDFTTIPSEYDDKEKHEALYNSCFPARSTNEKILSNRLDSHSLVILFGMEHELYNRICEIGEVSFYSPVSILLGFLARNPRDKERYMLACYTGNRSTLIAMEGERPTLINAFATDEIHNQLFYLLSIWNELHFEQEDDTLVLCGDNTADKLHGEAKNFIRNIERINARELFMPNLLNKIENTPFDLQALILCE